MPSRVQYSGRAATTPTHLRGSAGCWAPGSRTGFGTGMLQQRSDGRWKWCSGNCFGKREVVHVDVFADKPFHTVPSAPPPGLPKVAREVGGARTRRASLWAGRCVWRAGHCTGKQEVGRVPSLQAAAEMQTSSNMPDKHQATNSGGDNRNGILLCRMPDTS